MMAAVSVQPLPQSLWDSVLQLTKSAQEKNADPLHWAIQLSSSLASAGVALPSADIADLLVSHICFENHVPIAWKLLEKALSVKIVPPMLVLALLSTRVIPNRRLHPAAYRLYMELVRRHAFAFSSEISGPNSAKMMKSIDDVLHLSDVFGLEATEPGIFLVQFLFSVVWKLVDASLDDEGLLELTLEKKSRWLQAAEDMEIDGFADKRSEHNEGVVKGNTTMAIELIGEFLRNRFTSRILYLAFANMPSHWGSFSQGMQTLLANSVALRSSKLLTPEDLEQLLSKTTVPFHRFFKTKLQLECHASISATSIKSSAGQWHGTSQSELWLPIDLFLEECMDGSQLAVVSAIENLVGLVKSLRAINGCKWQDTFLGLWTAALRLVQRERDPREGPDPRLDTCLCLLLSVTTITVAEIIEEEESELVDVTACYPGIQKEENQGPVTCREGLVSALQILGDYEGLLTPPQSVTPLANQAAAKATVFVSGLATNNGYYENVSLNDMPIDCSGNLRHLIVEACIARNVLDTSAYLWPGYVGACTSQVPSQMPGWSSLMKGSALTPAMMSTLVATPASCLSEIEKIYEIAVNGSNDEKISAAIILCGASLLRGWNVQDHTILFIIKLLSPPVPADSTRSQSHLIDYAPLLYVLLLGMSPVDCVQILSLHGLAPLLAGALMPICEVFGSIAPDTTWTLPTGEEVSCHALFSCAFSLLVRLWRFHFPPSDQVMGDVTSVGSQLSPDYLLMVRNSRLAAFGTSPRDQIRLKRFSQKVIMSRDPIFMDSFPKLKIWYRHHLECMSCAFSGLVPGTPVHQIVEALLTIMFRKINRNSQPVTATSSGSSNSSGPAAEEALAKLKVPAWDILEATPFALDAALTACGHGRLSPRDLATGLKDLADFLPATLATIASYFAAEVTRGIWKPACMNGSDWPSPAANLAFVEQQIKKILAATGVNVPSLTVAGSSPATLPLPLAALVSLTITYKLDQASDRFLTIVGPALTALGAGCPWPCMPIIASLWVQKAKRWSDFLVFHASQTVFHHNSDAVVQLLKSCFACTLGLTPLYISTLKSHGVKVARTHMHDWFILLLLIVIEIVLNIIEPFHRFVGKDMLTDLSFPLKSNTVPVWAVPIVAVLLPLVIISVYYFFRRDVYDLHHAVLGLAYSVLITGVITDAIKDAVGRPRPDFFWRCFPDGKGAFDPVTTEVICTGVKSVIKEGHKSFPSGHTSWSFAGLGFLALYLSGKIRVFDQRGHVAKLCILFAPLLLAALIGISRVDDYWHHWQDVFAGGLIGLVVSSFCYLQFFPPPHNIDGWGPHAYFQMLAETASRDQPSTNSSTALIVQGTELESVYVEPQHGNGTPGRH